MELRLRPSLQLRYQPAQKYFLKINAEKLDEWGAFRQKVAPWSTVESATPRLSHSLHPLTAPRQTGQPVHERGLLCHDWAAIRSRVLRPRVSSAPACCSVQARGLSWPFRDRSQL